MKSFGRTLGGCLLMGVLWGPVPVALAQDIQAPPDRSPPDSGPAAVAVEDAGLPPAEIAGGPPLRPDLAAIQTTTQRIRDFLAVSLGLDHNPAALFDIDISDESAIQVEIERLHGVIVWGDHPPVVAPWPVTSKRHRERHAKRLTGATPDAGTVDSGVASSDPVLFAARLELDRVRLTYYLLPAEQRSDLVNQHRERQRVDREKRVSAGLSEAQQRSQEAEAARRRAVEAAQRARSEAERLVEEERARLLAVSRRQADFEAELERSRMALTQRAEQTLSFRRRVRELLAHKPVGPVAADRLYDELRTFLRASRNQLDNAISQIFARTTVPGAAAGSLGNLPEGIDKNEVVQLTEKIETARADLTALEKTYRSEHALQLYNEVKALNIDRLSLLHSLSEPKQNSITGLSYGGLDQAGAEIRQVTLVLRYHGAATRRWVMALWQPTSQRTGNAFVTGYTVLKWFVLILAFVWWRRRSDPMLGQWRERLQKEERRTRAAEPSPLYRLIRFLQRTRRPLEWLIFLWLLVWLLPEGSGGHLELALVTTTFTWILGGAFVVSSIDTLARGRSYTYIRTSSTTTDHVRLRSLKLAGRTVVVLGLLLSLSALLVGRGTIYSWSLSFCWIAAIPVFLVILRWWRDIIFQRVVAVRKKKTYHRWVEAHQTGWVSFPAVVSAGVYLFVQGSLKAGRNWFTGFDLTRRALAYLFRRGMDRLAEEQKTTAVLKPLPEDLFQTLGPGALSDVEISSSDEEGLNEVMKRVSGKEGGVFAIVGERGRGKTTVLHRVCANSPDVVVLDCPVTGLEGLRQAIVAATGADASSTFEECVAQMDAPDGKSGLLIDHAHRLIHPVMGGLVEFDRLLKAARSYSKRCTWSFAFNEVIWRFLARARGSQPLFDDVIRLEPWREEEIGQLLATRCKQAGIEPSFEHVMEPLPFDADEIDREEALKSVTAGYFRMIWDYSAGNAAVALHTWRRSLGMDSQGQVCVRLFRVPDSRELEDLPEHAAFVLRAVIQLEPALAADVVSATMLRPSQTEDLLRYGTSHGYFEKVEGRYRVTWAWFRPITRFLQRRHLLAEF